MTIYRTPNGHEYNPNTRYTLTEFLYLACIPKTDHPAATERILAAAVADGISPEGLATDDIAHTVAFWIDLSQAR